MTHLKGDPPVRYTVPTGWVRIGLSVNQGPAQAHDVFNRWYVSYHGTDKSKVRAIVAQQMPLHPGVVTVEGVRLEIKPGHIPDGVCIQASTSDVLLSWASPHCRPFQATRSRCQVVWSMRVQVLSLATHPCVEALCQWS